MIHFGRDAARAVRHNNPFPMKLPKTATRIALWFGVAALAACGGADSGSVTADWHASGMEGKQIALQTHRLLLVAFMGSDWSEPCQNIKKNVLDTPVFKSFADANLVLVMADFPRSALVPPEVAKQNADMARGAQIDRLPVFMLVDPRTSTAFNRIANFTGGPEQFVAQIQAGIEQYEQALHNSAQAVSAAAVAGPSLADLPPSSGPSFSQPAPIQPAASPILPGFPGSLPSPEELMRRQQQPPPQPQ